MENAWSTMLKEGQGISKSDPDQAKSATDASGEMASGAGDVGDAVPPQLRHEAVA